MQRLRDNLLRGDSIAIGVGICAVAAGTAYYLYNRSSSSMAETLQDHALDLRNQAIDVPSEIFLKSHAAGGNQGLGWNPGENPPITWYEYCFLIGQFEVKEFSAKRCTYSEKLVESYDGATTAYECYLRGARLSGDSPCLGTQSNGSYNWITYNQTLERGANFGSGLISLGYKASQETTVGIYAINRVEWVLTDIACVSYSMVSVPLYDSLGSDACSYIINHADIAVAVCDADKLDILLENAEKCPKLKHIIKIGEVDEKEKEKAEKFAITLVSFQEVEELGKNNPQEKKPSQPDDLYTICFTSGTTGQPKGVMITNKNKAANLAGFIMHLEKNGIPLLTSDTHISYLPLPHSYERTVQLMVRCVGGRTGFYGGNVKLLLDDLQLLRPTFFPSVPRLLNRLYDKITAGVDSSGGLKKWLFNKAYASKEADVLKGIISKDTFWDKLVFRKVQALLGGRVRIIGTGAAPIEPKILTFLKVVFGCYVLEGYGQTECTGLICATNIRDLTTGHVGPPAACNYIKLVDVPEMEYYASNNQGEICVYGPCAFKGYLKLPDKTAEVLQDGWVHTGDIGEWTKEGTLKITGRKKCIFKLSQGEYVAPEKVENIYIKSPFVAQVFVYGHSVKSCTIGILVPDEEILMKWAKDQNISGTFSELCQRQEVAEVIHKDIIEKGKEAKLAGFEQVKAIFLHPELFSMENNLLTPTMKLRRFNMQKMFSAEIEKMYQKLENVEHPTTPS